MVLKAQILSGKWGIIHCSEVTSRVSLVELLRQVGVLIEEPFPILALDRMCAKVHENIQELADLQVQSREHLSKKLMKVQSRVASNGVTR